MQDASFDDGNLLRNLQSQGIAEGHHCQEHDISSLLRRELYGLISRQLCGRRMLQRPCLDNLRQDHCTHLMQAS